MADQNWAFIAAAYTVTWIVILGYLIRVHRSLARARAEYERVTGRRLERAQ